MEQFKISRESIDIIIKTNLKKTLPFFVVAIGAGIAINQFSATNQGEEEFNPLLVMIPFICVLVYFGVKKNSKRQKQLLASYMISLDEHVIIREQFDTPTVRIGSSSIKEIIKASNGSIVVKGNSSEVIIIPVQIERFSELETLLNNFAVLQDESKQTLIQKYIMFAPLMVVGLMIAVYTSNNKIVVGVSGTLLVISAGYSFIMTRNSKNIDNTVKKSMWWLLVVCASVIAVMFFKITQ